ncbi:helix-turn-helix domain-containing protein [Hyphomonadaceae bacterium ML37]|nr:helix-turn-helix domain-containing protein [Hyphomonadaceae bacterium ML37]
MPASEWGARLRTFRQRTGLKQLALADELGVSQAFLSRLETGTANPSDALAARIAALLERPCNRLIFDDWRATVALSPGLSSLLGRYEGAVRLCEFSGGFRAMGGAFETSRDGDGLEGLLGEDADRQFAVLTEAGAFDGEVSVSESTWSTQTANGEQAYFHSVNVPVRDDYGRWRLHSTHAPISAVQYRSRVDAGLATVIRARNP